jgi:hypothetical protein
LHRTRLRDLRLDARRRRTPHREPPRGLRAAGNPNSGHAGRIRLSCPAGILSDAQLGSVVYAGEAHAGHLAGSYTVDETYDTVPAAPEDAEGAVRFRRGWFLGDGTGAGKGRQVAAIILDNWLKGRRRAP